MDVVNAERFASLRVLVLDNKYVTRISLTCTFPFQN
jgi:hypothetical protein